MISDGDLEFNNLQGRSYKKGQMLLFQGEVPRCGFILKRGIVKEYDINKQGNEQITWLVNPLEVFPFSWLMDLTLTASYYYETVSDCDLYVITIEEYAELLHNDKNFLYNELKKQAKKENAQTRRLAAVLNAKAENKLVNTFQYLVESYGSSINPNKSMVEINLTHQDLANLTGLTRETVSKELGELKKRGIIYKSSVHSNYEVVLDKLNELLSTPLSSI